MASFLSLLSFHHDFIVLPFTAIMIVLLRSMGCVEDLVLIGDVVDKKEDFKFGRDSDKVEKEDNVTIIRG